jgi:UDP-N-acetylglucosamine 2-epimerase (non-hydrolysing)
MHIKKTKKKIFSIFGTRPEAIKMAPVIISLKKYGDSFVSRVCLTGQHRQMLDQVLGLFEIKPDYDLNIMKPGQDLFDVTVSVLIGLKSIFAIERPDMVLVQGDTTTTMAASLASFYHRIPVGHIEAGLRSRNKYAPFPEEINRKISTVVADIHFAPTETARKNLVTEGVDPGSICVSGNTVIDTLYMTLENIKKKGLRKKIVHYLIKSYPSLAVLYDSNNHPALGCRLILVTGHRRENFGKGFENICLGLKAIADNYRDVQIVYPVHLNPNVQEPVRRILKDCANIHLIEPLEYLPFVYLMNQSYMIITDSGGIQEEAPSLGKPVLVMRENTERPEAVDAGTVRLVGTDSKKIIDETSLLLEDNKLYDKMSKSQNPYGDGKAAYRILGKLLEYSEKLN